MFERSAKIDLALKGNMEDKGEDARHPGTDKIYPKVVEVVPATSQVLPKAKPKASLFSPKLLLIVIVPSILIGVLAGGLFYLSKNHVEPQGSPSPASLPEESTLSTEIEQTVKAEEAKLAISGLKVNILNGSGVPGEANAVSGIISFEGFDNFESGNADAFTYTDTKVAVKESANDAYIVIERALNDQYTVAKANDFLPETSPFDIVITVGKRK